MIDFIRSHVLLAALDDTNATNVAATNDGANIADIELVEADNLVGPDINLDGVVGSNAGIGKANGARVCGISDGDALGANNNALHLALQRSLKEASSAVMACS